MGTTVIDEDGQIVREGGAASSAALPAAPSRFGHVNMYVRPGAAAATATAACAAAAAAAAATAAAALPQLLLLLRPRPRRLTTTTANDLTSPVPGMASTSRRWLPSSSSSWSPCTAAW